jgi:transcriptional regulator NrdR family protein
MDVAHSNPAGPQVFWRRRECRKCGQRETTYEMIATPPRGTPRLNGLPITAELKALRAIADAQVARAVAWERCELEAVVQRCTDRILEAVRGMMPGPRLALAKE